MIILFNYVILVFSLFNVVTFKNDACVSNSGTTGTTGYPFINMIENKFSSIILSYVFIPDEIAMELALLQMNVLIREAQHLDLVPLGNSLFCRILSE